MKKKMVAIGLFPDRLDLLVVQGGRVINSRRLPVTFDGTADGWPLSLRKAGPALSDAVRDMKLTGWCATVLFVNPTATAEYVCVKASSATEAGEAAILTASDSLAYPLALAVTGAAVITGNPKNADGQTHVIIGAERDDHAGALADFVHDAGLKLSTVTPIDAAVMMHVAIAALADASIRAAHLYIGEHRSFLVIVENQTIIFARPVGLGMHTLATSLTRPLRPANAPGCEPVEIDPRTAKSILHKFGFPDRSQIVHEPLGLTGAQIIPLLQPVLQRFVVELRQSLRFGLAEEHRQSIVIHLSGPGSAIPNFAGIVAAELRVKVEVDPAYAGVDYDRPESKGSELIDALADPGVWSRINLQPRELARTRQIARLQRWMWTGAAAALALVGFESLSTHGKLKTVKAQADAIAAQNSEAQSMHASCQKMLGAIEALTSLDNSIASLVGAQVNFGACMQEIAGLVPSSIKLTGIRFNQNDRKTTGSIQGYAFAEKQAAVENKSSLEVFITKLNESPLFDKVALGNVQVATSGSRPAQQFEVGVVGVEIPKSAVSAALAQGATANAQADDQEGTRP